MNSANPFDLIAAGRALALTIVGGLIVNYILSRFSRINRMARIILVLVIGVICALMLFYRWPSLVEVPTLDNLACTEAEDKLEAKGLVAEAIPQFSGETERDRVIPHSQRPSSGLKVRRGTVVRFAVSQGSQTHTVVTPQTVMQNVALSMFRPESGSPVRCMRDPSNIYHFEVSGTSSGLSQNYQLLLWVKPVHPPSETPGWYLQRFPNGITIIEPNGSWSGRGQLGNAQFPPREGDIFDIAVTVADRSTVNSLLGEMGVVTRAEPVGTRVERVLDLHVILR